MEKLYKILAANPFIIKDIKKDDLCKVKGTLNTYYTFKNDLDYPTISLELKQLVIVSDDELQENEYGVDIRDKKIFKVQRILSNHYESGVLSFQKSYCKKIIASNIPLDNVEAIPIEVVKYWSENPIEVIMWAKQLK